MGMVGKPFDGWAAVGWSRANDAGYSRTARATQFYRANKVFTMEKSLGWGTMLKYS